MNNLKIPSIFVFFLFLMTILSTVFLFFSINKPASYISPLSTYKKKAVRGDIIANNFTLAHSKKVFNIYINPNNLIPDKKKLFIDLFSIYANIDKKVLINKLSKQKRVLIAKVDEITKNHIYRLNKILALKYRVFRPTSRNIIIGIEIEPSNPPFKRVYLYNDLFEPYLGRYRIDTQAGDNGIEKYYENLLRQKEDGYIKGLRDVLGRVIFDNKAKIKYPINGQNIYTKINLVVQKKIENLADKMKIESNASEVLAAVMESNTGQIIALVSSNRYNPNYIKKEDIPNMKISAIRTLYEPGSVLKPITLAILLEHNKVNLLESIKGHNGQWKPKWRKTPIKDDTPFKWLTPREAIIYSSNIAISELVLRLSPYDFYNGLIKFGLKDKSGIDLPYEIKGKIRPISLLKYPIFQTTTAYGYGIVSNFIELLKAYNIFNNNGIMVNPRIALTLQNKKKAISSTTAKQILDILRDVVLKGTAKKAYIKGVFTAGKTGTAHVNIKGKYLNIYNSSFFGFANDKNHKYTIGITFFNIKSKQYFASQTAVPMFKKIVNILIEENLLKADYGK